MHGISRTDFNNNQRVFRQTLQAINDNGTVFPIVTLCSRCGPQLGAP